MAVSKSVCYLALKDVAKQYVDLEDIDNFCLEHEAKVKELMAANTLLTNTEAEVAAAKELVSNIRYKALLAKRNSALQAIKTIKAINWIKTTYPNPKDWEKGIQDILGGSWGKFQEGSMNSVSNRVESRSLITIANFLRELEVEGLDKVFKSKLIRDKNLERDIMIELAELREGGKPGKSGSTVAKKIADIMAKHQEIARITANKKGAFIEKIPGYIIAQTHSQEKLAPKFINGRLETETEAFERWYNFILPRLDWARTFKGQDKRTFLYEAWKSLRSGVHLTYENGIGIATGGNKAQKLSNERKFFFNSGEHFFEYNEAYGEGDLFYGYRQGLDRLARNTAIMESMGVNPEKMIDDIYKTLRIDSRTVGPFTNGAGIAGKHWSNAVDNMFKHLMGMDKIPASNILASIGTGTRGTVSAGSLGMATISSFSDIASQINQAAYLGISRTEALSNIARTLSLWSERKLTPEERQVLSSFGMVTDALIDSFHARVNAGNYGNGFWAKALDTYFNITGLNGWNSSLKKAMSLSICHELGEFLAGTNIGALHPRMQKVLAAFNIGDKELALLKETPLVQARGRHFIDATNINQIPDTSIAKYLGIDINEVGAATKIANMKEELKLRLQTFVLERSRSSVLEPDLRVQSLLLQGTQAGTPAGEGLRAVAQFKSFTITALTKNIFPWMMGAETRGDKLRGYAGIAEFLVASTILGYFSVATKEVLKGRTVPEFDENMMKRALLQGGALGVAGDILFGEAQNSLPATAFFSGPTLNIPNDILSVYMAARDGDDAAAEAMKRIRHYIPGGNLFYAQVPLNYLFLYRMQELANPGYLERMEQNLYNKTGQEYFIKPSEFIQ